MERLALAFGDAIDPNMGWESAAATRLCPFLRHTRGCRPGLKSWPPLRGWFRICFHLLPY